MVAVKVDSVVVHYDEIGLKGSNRAQFEKLLTKNIKQKLGKHLVRYERERGQIVLFIDEIEHVEDALRRIPGIAHFVPSISCDLDIDKIREIGIELMQGLTFETFKVDTKRHNKQFSLTSVDVNTDVGQAIARTLQRKAKMRGADAVLTIEITNKHAFLSTGRITGVGGLPTDGKQKVVALLSGGFDSPVAAYMLMKRGCEVILVHCKNKNIHSSSVESKITDLAAQLSKYQQQTKLFIAPFDEIQKQIIMHIPAEKRMLIYRRFMFHIGAGIAKTEGARFLIVGDSLCQVASQTLENLEATYAEAPLHVLSPLIGMDKRDIMAISREIGTYEISSLPYEDCCSFFVPKHPELRAKAHILQRLEEKLDVNELASRAVADAKLIEY